MKRAALILCLVTLLGGSDLRAAAGQERPAEKPAGTGVIVHPEGYVLTAYHVVSNARRIIVVTPGEVRNRAVVVSLDGEQDLALLKIETVGLSEAPVGYAGAVRLDQEVFVPGFPFGLRDISVTRGRVVAVRTKGVKRVFQLDAPMNPGNSGGPVFNHRGELIGIVTSKFSHPSGIVPEGMAFAVPVSYATPLLANIPDFDFAGIGKGRKAQELDAEALVGAMVRTTVRVETLRVPEPAGPPAAKAQAETRPRPMPSPPAGRGPEAASEKEKEPENIAQVNGQLVAAQQEELQRLAQRGILPPEGMVLIPTGEFLMGDEDGPPDVRPLHRTFLSSYWIDRYEVTNAQYAQCVLGGVCLPPRHRQAFDDQERAGHPVTNVTWSQARTYCQWRGGRLPTEAEWEKAARGTDGRRHPWGNSDEGIRKGKNGTAPPANEGTAPGGSAPEDVSPYGVLDMAGNVSEWVKDWYAENYYAAGPSHDPQGPLRGSFRVLRGGDWTQSHLELRLSHRGWDEMTYWGPMLGFRCAADVQ